VYDTSPQAAAITSYRRGMRKKVGKTVTASAESLRRCIEINTLGTALFLKNLLRARGIFLMTICVRMGKE